MEDITAKYEDLTQNQEEFDAELEEAQKALESPSLISFDPLKAQNRRFYPHMAHDPSTFYNMTLYGNIGTLVLHSVSLYPAAALSLPKPKYYALDNVALPV